jgi:hypothetical protein
MRTDPTAQPSNSSEMESASHRGRKFDGEKIRRISKMKAHSSTNQLLKKDHRNEIVEITPAENVPGYTLNTGPVSVWFAEEIHAINHAQDCFPERDIVVRRADGTIKHRYSAQPSG